MSRPWVYKLGRDRFGRIYSDDLRQALKLAMRRAQEKALPSWNEQFSLEAKYPALAWRRVGKTAAEQQLRRDDLSSWLARYGLEQAEIQNVELIESSSKCKEAGGGKYCPSYYVYRHPDIEWGRCWRCTAQRGF